MSEDIDDILIDGERVLWRGGPDYAAAKDNPRSWLRRRLEHIAWIVGLGAAAWIVFFLGQRTGLGGPAAWIGGFLVVCTVLALLGFVNAKPTTLDLSPVPPTYLVTDRRVVQILGEDERTSVFGAGAAFLDLRRNGKVHDIWIFSPVEQLEMKLVAIPDGPAVERLIVTTLAARPAGTPS